MPWKDQSIMESRVRFVRDYAKGLLTMRELCATYGISRPTGYKWLGRAASGQSLADRSRAPHHCPHRTPAALERAIVAERLRHPDWGPDKVRTILQRREPDKPWPSSTTMGAILKRHDLVQPRRPRRRRSAGHPAAPIRAGQSNDVWSADFKGQFRMGDRQYCYPLTVADAHSRYLIGCLGLPTTAGESARAVFERLFGAYGLPRAILTDNGGPFACHDALARLSRLSVWWVRLGILPVTIAPGKPQQNGKHERMHRTLKAATTRPPGADLADQQARFDRFRREFNHDRPHAALDQRPPTQCYRRSPRPMPAKLDEPDYPGHFEVRRVRPDGTIKFAGRRRFLSTTLAGQWIGLEEVDDGVWSVYLDWLRIARYRPGDGELVGVSPASRWAAPLALRAHCAAQRDQPECQPCTR